MARHLSEMMLIVRAQNQASGALRRVGKDLSALGRHRNLQIQQQKLLLQQQNLLRQRAAATRRLESLTTGKQALALQRRAIDLAKAHAALDLKREKFQHAQRALANGIIGGNNQLLKQARQLHDLETRRLIKAHQIARINRVERAALASRAAMLKKAGGLKGVSAEDDKSSKEGIKRIRFWQGIRQRQLDSLKRQQEEVNRASEATTRTIAQQGRAAGLLGKALHNTGLESQKLAVREKELGAAHKYNAQQANEARSQLRSIATRYAMATQQQKELSKAIRSARFEPISTLGRTVQHLGRVGQYAFLVFGGGLAYAAHQAAMFEKNVTLVATQTGKVDANFGRTTKTIVSNSKFLQKAFIGIQASGTSSMDDINEAAYNLFSTIDQLGDSRKGLGQGAKMMQLFSDAAIAGQTPITDVTEGVIGVLSAFDNIKPTATNVEKILNRMFATVRFGRMTFAELNESLTTLTPAAKSAGQTLDTTLGTFAFLSKPLGVAKARVGIPRLMEVLTRPKMVTGLKKLGIQVADSSGKMFQLPKIIDNITRKRPDILKNDLALMQFFKTVGGAEGTVMARRAFVFLARNLTGYQRILGKVTTDNNEFARSLKTMESTTGVRWEKFINQLRAIALMIGANVLPEILKLAPYFQKLVDWLQDMDPELRATIVHWTALAVALTGVVSAAAFLLGPLIRIAANLAKARLFLITAGAAFIAISAAIAIVKGEWDGLNTILASFFGLTDKGKWGWIAMFAIAAAGALKLARAVTAVRNAWIGASVASAAGTGAAGLGGMAGFFGKTKALGANLKAIPAAAKGATKLRTVLNMASLAAMAIPGPMWVAGAAIAVAAGGALLWKRHMDGVKRAAQEVKNVTLQMQAPGVAAARFGQTGTAMIDFKQAQVDAARIKKTINDLQNQFKKAKGAERVDIQLQLNQAYVDRARIFANLTTAYNNLRVASGGFTTYLARQRIALAQLGTAQMSQEALLKRRAALEKKLATMPDTGLGERGGVQAQLAQVNAEITKNEANIRKWAVEVNKGTAVARSGMNKLITTMQNLQMLPQKISPQMRQMAFDFQRQIGRVLTPAQMQRFFKIALNLDTAPANSKMAAFQRKWQAKAIKMSADIKIKTGKVGQLTPAEILSQGLGPLSAKGAKKALTIPVKLGKIPKLPKGFMGGLKIPPIIPTAKPGPARQTIETAFKNPIVQKINVSIPASGALAALGSNIVSGVAAGVAANNAITNALVQKVHEAEAAASGPKGADAGSPAKLFIPLGRNMIDGIIKGLFDKKPDIEKTAHLVIDLFNGAFLEKKRMKIEAIGDNLQFSKTKLAKYLQQQRDALAKFKKSKKEIDRIRAKEFGEKADQMKLRKGLSFGDLIKDAQGQVKAMIQFNNSLAKIKRRGGPKGFLDDLRALGVDGLKYINIIAGGSKKKFAEYIKIWQNMQKQIKRSQTTTITDLKEWKDSNKELFDETVKTAAQNLLDKWNEFKDQNKSNFGGLFEGPTNLADRIGSAFDDAVKAYDDSVKDFNDQIADLDKELVKANADAFKEIGRLNAEAIDEMARLTADALKERTNELKGLFGELFSGKWLQSETMGINAEWGITATFDDLLKDLTGQLEDFNLWRSTLASLAGKVPPEMAAALEGLGPAAISQLTILNGATTEQLAEYIRVWQASQGAISDVAHATFQTPELMAAIQSVKDTLNTEITAVNTDLAERTAEITASITELRAQLAMLFKPMAITGQEIINDLNLQIAGWKEWEAQLTALKDRGVPLQLISQLREMGPQATPYLQALNTLTDKQLISDPASFVNTWLRSQQLINTSTDIWMNEQLAIWRQYGSDMATAIIAGLATEQQALLNFFTNMFKSMLEGKFPTMPTGGGGGGGAQNTTGYMYSASPESMAARAPYYEPPSAISYNTSTNAPTTTINVTAVQDENLSNTIERASFRLQWRAE